MYIHMIIYVNACQHDSHASLSELLFADFHTLLMKRRI